MELPLLGLPGTTVPWSHHPQFLPDPEGKFAAALYQELKVITPITERQRQSVVFTTEGKYNYGTLTAGNGGYVSSGIPGRKWAHSPLVNKMKDLVELYLGHNIDYCLSHIYPDGNSSISYHADREALDSDVVSLSFGATRKFRLRPLGQTKGYTHEYLLGSGDLFHMLPGCQRVYEHTVPKETTVKTWRINLTFRQFESQ